MAEVITTEIGSPISFSNLAQSPAPWMQIEAFLTSRGSSRGSRRAPARWAPT